ncbi:MAG: ParB/RepB/Spo0J family partition protein [bacterium]
MIKKSGLGRGLGSLIPTKNNEATVHPPAGGSLIARKEENILDVPKELEEQTNGQLILEIPLGKISANPHQPRHVFDEDALECLVNSIKENGILQPLIVSDAGDGKFEIIAGERRFRAAKEIGFETVPAIARTVNEQQKLELALIENIQRENLNAIEEAKGYNRLSNEFNLTHEQIAKKVGKSRSQITNIIRLLDLPERIQDALIGGEITVGHAKVIASLDNETDQMELFKSIVRKNLNVRESERSIAKIKSNYSRFKNKNVKDPNILEKEELLRAALGTKVAISKRGGRGRVEIEYYSDEELVGIIDRIIK